MPPKKKRSRAAASGSGVAQQTTSAPAADDDDVQAALQQLEQDRERAAEEERALLLAEAQAAAAKIVEDATVVKAAAAGEAAAMRREIQRERAALEEEKAAMEKAHDFQGNKILLDVGGHKFTTSRQTLTAVADTYMESMFSGRFELSPDADGTYFIDRDGTHFRHVLNLMRNPAAAESLRSAVKGAQREELALELEFYGLLDRMMPYYAQERVGQSLLRRACLVGTKAFITTAVAQARALIFDMGSTTPFLNEEVQDIRCVITDRIVNGSPVWAAVGSDGVKLSMHRSTIGTMVVSLEADCTEGNMKGFLQNMVKAAAAVAPTELRSLQWVSSRVVTLASQFASAPPAPGSVPPAPRHWVMVPEMRIAAVHGLDDDDPAMAAALRQLAALT
jgi:hypothetical protein